MLQDIWILTRDGVVVFNRVFDETIEIQLFGALMSAINTFVEELSSESLESFEIQDTRYSILKKNEILFIASSSNKFKEKKIHQNLEYIQEKFFELYPDSFFQNWDHDISCFENFKDEIKDILENPIENFWKGF